MELLELFGWEETCGGPMDEGGDKLMREEAMVGAGDDEKAKMCCYIIQYASSGESSEQACWTIEALLKS